jgi:hypothetical protein
VDGDTHKNGDAISVRADFDRENAYRHCRKNYIRDSVYNQRSNLELTIVLNAVSEMAIFPRKEYFNVACAEDGSVKDI